MNMLNRNRPPLADAEVRNVGDPLSSDQGVSSLDEVLCTAEFGREAEQHSPRLYQRHAHSVGRLAQNIRIRPCPLPEGVHSVAQWLTTEILGTESGSAKYLERMGKPYSSILYFLPRIALPVSQLHFLAPAHLEVSHPYTFPGGSAQPPYYVSERGLSVAFQIQKFWGGGGLLSNPLSYSVRGPTLLALGGNGRSELEQPSKMRDHLLFFNVPAEFVNPQTGKVERGTVMEVIVYPGNASLLRRLALTRPEVYFVQVALALREEAGSVFSISEATARKVLFHDHTIEQHPLDRTLQRLYRRHVPESEFDKWISEIATYQGNILTAERL